MTLDELLDVMDGDRSSGIVVQVVVDGGEWKHFDTLNIDSPILALVGGWTVTDLEAVASDVIRVGIERNGETT